MRLWIKKAACLLSLLMMMSPSLGMAAVSEGQLLSITEFAPGLWKVTVQEGGAEKAYMVSTKTTLQKEIAVEAVKPGDRLLSKAKAGGGTKGFKAPFSNMSEATKKMLGLPDVPSVPEVPKIPAIPDKQQMQGSPASQGGGAPQAGPGGGMPGMGGGMAQGKQPPAEAPAVKTQDEMLQEKGFQNNKLLFPPESGLGSPGNEVTQVVKTDLGYEVTVVSETGQPEKKTYAPGKKILKAISLKDIKKNDKISLSFNETDKTVIELEVKG